MPLYYFDTTGANGECADEEGSVHADLDTAQRYARRALCEIAGDHSRGDFIAFAVRVRDQAGAEVYRAIITLTEPPPFTTAASSAEQTRSTPRGGTSNWRP